MKPSYLMRSALVGAVFGVAASAFAMSVDSPHGELVLSCESCHTTASWTELRGQLGFSHDTTAFPLVGKHAGVRCRSCHRSLVFSEAGTRCQECHLDIHRGQFAYACDECHTPAHWDNASEMRQRHPRTRFPLTGMHQALDCEACHAEGQYAGRPVECQGCHFTAYNQTTQPAHASGGFPLTCEQCHGTNATSWHKVAFDHGSLLERPLACYPCHTADYTNAANPNHQSEAFGEDCAACHSTTAWRPANFDHARTDFPLTGAHAAAACAQCHAGNRYADLPTDCYACHQTDFEEATNPNHVQVGIRHDCASCHTTEAWQPAPFDHGPSFSLHGAHEGLTCLQCHTSGEFSDIPTDCYACHRANFEGVTDPNHVTLNFDHNCTVCHTQTGWRPASFDHGPGFPLAGAHVGLACSQCHSSGYEGTPTACYGCHRDDYERVTDPNHVELQFDHDCSICHSQNGWDPATFDHSQTDFPLTGAHLNATCGQCHINGQYQGTPTECYFCHRTDYEGAQDPNHRGAGFPTDCQLCHTTINWDSRFDHDPYFPIYSGAHRRGEAWNQCSECHPNSSNYTVFSCIDCHEHNREETDRRHDEVPGYSYNSQACYDCHLRGGGDRLLRPRREPVQK